jgi:hypothetical protein
MQKRKDKKYGNENFKAFIHSTDRDGYKKGERGIFKIFGYHDDKKMQDVQVKFDPGLSWQEQYSARRKLFPSENLT